MGEREKGGERGKGGRGGRGRPTTLQPNVILPGTLIGHAPSPGLHAIAVGHSVPFPDLAAASVHVLLQSIPHALHCH